MFKVSLKNVKDSWYVAKVNCPQTMLQKARDMESPSFFQDNTNPAMYFTCQMGFGRSAVGLVMGHLLCAYQQKNQRFVKLNTVIRASYKNVVALNSGIDKRQKLVSPGKPNYERGEFRAVQKLIHVISEGEHVKFQVDTILDQCSMLCKLRTDILTTKLQLESITTDYLMEGQNAHHFLYKRCLDYLDRYFFLLCFSAYVREQFSAMLSMSFSKWLHTQPDIIRLWTHLSLPVSNTSQQLLNEGKHVLVADEYIGLDMLSSRGDLHVSNFRKISTKGISVYGMAQPARKGFAHVVNHLLCKKVKHNYVVLINLRNDIAIESDSTTYSVRSATNLEEPIIFPGFSHSELEEREENLKKLLSTHNKFQVCMDLSQPPEMEHQFTSVFYISELADQQKLQTLDMTYKRVPLQCDSAVEEKDFDNIMSVVCEYCQQEKMKSANWDPAFVFFCRTGKSRTTLAMAIAGLILCHYKGFPKGACVGEQPRISLPNAQYTNGDFIIVQKLVRILPKGQQMKREVDCILDEVFDTMTPMHFHLREIIFVTYNKMRKSRTEDERQMFQKLSIDYLERYIYLIIFNTFLHFDYSIQWKRPFSQWMKQVAAKSGVYELLDNLGFYDFELPLETFRTMSGRWKARVPEMQFQGEFL
ncbi:hypothetical protein CHS0354_028141 [Potamilus streckersoni]|uniref:Paladin n=2 Tax=Potamilus streckersoni TaxID=2493646 RepID=A0AAE0TIT5_9BIVA|nr:hypothetical protein CHS0354_028141 [Potamilus streckersoni]